MEIIAFQVGIFVIIIFCGLLGNSTRNIVTILVILFTMVMVFTNGLMIIQFITIGVAFMVSKSISTSNETLEISDYEKYQRDQAKLNKTTLSEYIGLTFLAIFGLLFLGVIILNLLGVE